MKVQASRRVLEAAAKVAAGAQGTVKSRALLDLAEFLKQHDVKSLAQFLKAHRRLENRPKSRHVSASVG